MKIETIIALIGAAAWTPWVYDRLFKRAKIKGKLISYLSNTGQFNGQKGELHFMKINLISLHRDFDVSKVSVRISYPEERFFDCKPFLTRTSNSHWGMPEGGHKHLRIPPGNFLPHVVVLPEGEVKTTYITFLGPERKNVRFEKVEFTLSSFSNRSQSIVFERNLSKVTLCFLKTKFGLIVKSTHLRTNQTAQANPCNPPENPRTT